MTNQGRQVSTASLGILDRHLSGSVLDEAAEQVRNLGYAVIEADLDDAELCGIARDFDPVRDRESRAGARRSGNEA